MITVLGLDPGTRNMAWSVIRIWSATRFKVLGVGMVKNAMMDMKGDIRPAMKRFRKELQSKIKRHGVTHIAAERFQARGLKGNTGELVAFMLGVISTFKQPSVFITASQWKNNFNKYADLKALYKKTALQPHEVDSPSIGLYVGLRVLGVKNPFEFLRAHRYKYIQVLEAHSETLRDKREKLRRKQDAKAARDSDKARARAKRLRSAAARRRTR